MCTNNLYFQGSQKNAKSNSKQHPVNKNEKKNNNTYYLFNRFKVIYLKF